MPTQAVSSVSFTKLLAPVKLTLPKIIMHFFLLSSRFTKIAAALVCYSVYLEVSRTNRQGFTQAVTGAASKVWWSTANRAAAEPVMIQGLPRCQMAKVLIQQIAGKMLSTIHHWFCVICATFLIHGVMSDYCYSFDHRGTWQRTILTPVWIVLSESSLSMVISPCAGSLFATCYHYIQTYVHTN